MKHIDLFSGIGGFALAAQWTWGDKYDGVAHSETNEFRCKIYHKRFEGSRCLGDANNIDWQYWLNVDKTFSQIDLLTGGFTCQPYSQTGKRRGKADDRDVWPAMLRAVQKLHPAWVVGENVTGLISLGLDDVLVDLEKQGYEVQAFVIPACALGAWHRRDRVWIVAHSKSKCSRAGLCRTETCAESVVADRDWIVTDTESQGLEGCEPTWHLPADGRAPKRRPWRWPADWWTIEPGVGRVVYGVPNRMDRLRAIGDAIVPQVAWVILSAIRQHEKGNHRVKRVA